LYFIKKT